MRTMTLAVSILTTGLVLASNVGAAINPCAPFDASATGADVTTAINGIKEAGESDRIELVPTTAFLPAGAAEEFVLQRPYDDAERINYFAIIDGDPPKIVSNGDLRATAIAADHPLVQKKLTVAKRTLLTMDVPRSVGSLWLQATVYVYGCEPKASTPKFIAVAAMPVSDPRYTGGIVWGFIAMSYLLIATAAWTVDTPTVGQAPKPWVRYLDPVVLTAGSNGKGSLAKLQILFFSVIVAGLVAYIVARTGILTELSTTILLLLGIAGVGSAASKATDVTRNRIDFENWAWFIRKKWLPPGGLAAINCARWRDVVTSDGEFDVYHFQNLIFSVVVGAALVAEGLRDLASFSVPEGLLGVLGLSQVVYLGGKLVMPPSCSDLNKEATQLRGLERDFVDTATKNPDPQAASAVSASAAPLDIASAVRRAGQSKYDAYLDKAKSVRIMFESVTGRTVDDACLAPTLTP